MFIRSQPGSSLLPYRGHQFHRSFWYKSWTLPCLENFCQYFVNIISTKIDEICPWEWVQYLTVDALQYFIFKLCPFPEHYRIHVPCVCLCGWILMVRLIVQRLYYCHSSCPWLNCRETICKYWSKHSSLTDTAQVQL